MTLQLQVPLLLLSLLPLPFPPPPRPLPVLSIHTLRTARLLLLTVLLHSAHMNIHPPLPPLLLSIPILLVHLALIRPLSFLQICSTLRPQSANAKARPEKDLVAHQLTKIRPWKLAKRTRMILHGLVIRVNVGIMIVRCHVQIAGIKGNDTLARHARTTIVTITQRIAN